MIRLYQSREESTTAHFEEIRRSLGIIYKDGDVGELRCFGKRKTCAGYFDDLDKMSQEACHADTSAYDVYITLNPCKEALLGRADNQLIEVDTRHTPLASDKDIEQRRWILVDCDPDRPAKVSSTDTEKDHSLKRARGIWAWLKQVGIDANAWDSGNGAHLLIPVDLPNDKASASLVEKFLKAISFQFSDNLVKVDESTFNAARLTKPYGVHARKGQNVERLGRIHRPSRMLMPPDTLGDICPADGRKLEAVIKTRPEEPPRTRGGSHRASGGQFAGDPSGDRLDLHQWIVEHGVTVRREGEWGNGGYRWILEECIWNGHTDNSAYIVQGKEGWISAGCSHDSCQTGENRWFELREHFEPDSYSPKGSRDPREANSGDSGDSGDSIQNENVEPWAAPAAFHSYALPEFPKDVFPKWMSDYTEALATATQTPRDLAGMLGLTVGALGCAKLVEVEVWEDWIEPTNLFTTTVLRPGTRKTEVFKRICRPVQEYEVELGDMVAPDIAKARTKYRVYEGRLKKAEQQAAKADDSELEELENKAVEAAEALATIDVPSDPQLLADDASPERLATILAEQRGRVALMSDEGGIFDMMAGRYSQGVPNLDVYLKGHAGVDLRVDRVGRPTDHVRAPALTTGLAVQPDVLKGLAGKPGFRGRGLLGRYLYSKPKDSLGSRETRMPGVPTDVKDTYSSNVKAMLELSPRLPSDRDPARKASAHKPHRLKLDAAAQNEMEALQRWLEPQLADGAEFGDMTDWAGKLAGAVARIAGILHVLGYAGDTAPWKYEVKSDVVRRAIKIGKYLIPHAKYALAFMGSDPAVEDAKYILRWIERSGNEGFSKRDVWQDAKGRFDKVSELEPALNLLIEHGYIREDQNQKQPRGRGRKPSPRYEVNPIFQSECYPHNPHNPHNSANEGWKDGEL